MITHNAVLTYRREDSSQCGRMAQTYTDGQWVVLDLNEMGSFARMDVPSAETLIRILELAVADIKERQ